MGKKVKERKKRAAKRKHIASREKAAAGAASVGDTTDAMEASEVSSAEEVDVKIEPTEPQQQQAQQQDPTTSSAERGLKRPTPHDVDPDADGNGADANDGWETVHRSKKAKKLPTKNKKKYPSIDFSNSARLDTTVRVSDLRDLVLYIFADGVAPRWVSVSNRNQIRKIVAVMIPGVEEAMFQSGVDLSTFQQPPIPETTESKLPSGPDDYYPKALDPETLPTALKPLAEMFNRVWPVKTPGDDRYARMHSPLTTFLTAPLPKRANDGNGGVKPAKEPPGFQSERTRITEFLATRDELLDNGYLLHPVLTTEEEAKTYELEPGWVSTRVERLEDAEVPEKDIQEGSLTAGREILSMDCEMVMTGPKEFSLARISIVDWAGDVVLDQLVKPDKPVTDYVTQYSGITKAMLEPVTTTLQDVQSSLLDLIGPRTILIGHSLDSDLKALKLVHPFIVDTSIIYPHPRGPPLKSSLKYLTQKYLNRQIQQGHGATGHSSVEDAKACLDLARQKCEKGKMWGEFEGGGENLFRRLARAGTSYSAHTGAGAGDHVRTTAAVDWGEPSKGPGAGATHALGCQSDEEVTSAVIRAVQGDADGAEIRAGGVDFVWARMRELEALRGWWNKNRAHDGSGPPDLGHLYVDESDPSASPVEVCLRRLVANLARIYEALPPCTALILLSGSGDPREMSRLQGLKARWRQEYNAPGSNWDKLSVKWTDAEEQLLKKAVRRARGGVGFVGVK
ncbi:related to ribonuclease H [Cephalotrichum gorgonifer]|uniref:Related to ribonuclease H n=1 Tax=Cephalotrichum gorgonifer TaxID=2041049 RepID=A0AAE8N0S9_9PEZI|nr:related to ribonuclease H [Cephalotrichum gorgonifer]